jgi:hypothetical protein
VRQTLKLRLAALEARVRDPPRPRKPLPPWLVEGLVANGVPFDASGEPDWRSLEARSEEASDQDPEESIPSPEEV